MQGVEANGRGADTRGKHRVMVELKRLEQEMKALEKELEELETMDKVSASFPELVLKVDSQPDPLLPITVGPANPSWERWFEGPQELHRCRCWVL